MQSSRTAILVAAVTALLAKLACAALTRGTNDVDAFYNFGRFIWEHGLIAQYRASLEFNHPPLTGWFCALIYGFGRGNAFPFLLRLPGILADFGSVWLLLRCRDRLPTWALVLFALSPVSFMVSGFHGNVDGGLVLLLLLAALAGGAGRPASCGLWLGLACQVKVIPLLVAPVFFFHWLARGHARRFFTAASLTILAGWSLPLVALPEVFLRNVLGYSSNWGGWGIPFWLTQTHLGAFAPVGFAGLTPAERATMALLKIGIVAAALGIAWRRRGLPPAALFSTLGIVWLVFFVFAPGIGAQYLVWLAPFLLVRSPGGYLAVTTASAAFLFVFYQTICGGLPWDHGVSTAELLPRWAGWSNAPWLALAALLVCSSSSSSSSSSS